MDFFDLVENRYSVRSYKNDAVEQEKLIKVLEAARLAPTACNLQAFKIVVINIEGRKEELKKINSRDFFTQAPIIIGVFANTEKNWKRSDGKNYSDVDAAIIMDHIILASTNLGLGTCWIGAFNKEAAVETASLGREYEPVAFTPIGYADTTNPKKVRKALEDLVVYL